MKFTCWIIPLTLLIATLPSPAQKKNTDTHITGHVIGNGEHIPFATVHIKGTTMGTVTDETGHYRLLHVPVGKLTLVATYVGYREQEITVVTHPETTTEVKFELEQDVLGLEEVVISSDRNERKRKDAPVIVNTVSDKMLSMTQSATINEGLVFTPGIRMENNCQNCGFNQVRMNGMEGPYSQILINNRPVFSGLAGVYGLELIPANMIERIEVVRGAGSALFGSNAIAGTINLILKDPLNDSYQASATTGINGFGVPGTGDPGMDSQVMFNASSVSGDRKTGLSVFGFHREKKPFDANDDGFSELTSQRNTTVGTRFFHRFGYRSKLSADFFNIREKRRGGDMLDYPLHEANIAEHVEHNITNGSLTFDRFFRENDLLSVYASAQLINRDSYYGAEQSLSDYGYSYGFTYNAGAQYKALFGSGNLVTGLEATGDRLLDKKLGYSDYEHAVIENDSIVSVPRVENRIIANQWMQTYGAFSQYEIRYEPFTFSVGARLEHYQILNQKEEEPREQGDVTGLVFSPRVNLMYNLNSSIQARLSYSEGYRAPQVFDEDLHIETSGSRKVIHRNHPELEQENSHSVIASLDINSRISNAPVAFLAEVFYTRLQNPFTNEFGEPDEEGVVVYTRVNSNTGATVQGVNLELDLVPTPEITLKAGYTLQSSYYDEPREFDEAAFFRTPGDYGYFTAFWSPSKKVDLTATGTYTGKMLVPHFGPDPATASTEELEAIARGDIIAGEELVTSGRFMELGIKASYNIKLNGAWLQVFGGLKNILNSYQDDFDRGLYRDPGYIYGPNQPRMIYLGLKVGNNL